MHLLCFVNPDEVELILSSIFLDQLETHLDIISPDSESPRKASTPLHCWFSVSPLMVWILEKHWYLPGKKLQKAVTSVLESHPNTILKSSYMQCRLLSNADCSIPALVVHSSQDLRPCTSTRDCTSDPVGAQNSLQLGNQDSRINGNEHLEVGHNLQP